MAGGSTAGKSGSGRHATQASFCGGVAVMTTDNAIGPHSGLHTALTAAPSVARPVRFWPVVALLAAFWLFSILSPHVEMATLVRFLSRIAGSLFVAFGFSAWWFFNRHFSLRERFAWFAGTLAVLTAAGFACHRSFGVFGMLFFGLPCILSVAIFWLLLARKQPLTRQRLGLFIILVLVAASFTLLRTDGLSGEQQTTVRWRWTPTAEELFLREREQSRAPSGSPSSATRGAIGDDAEAPTVQPGDWPRFRGPHGNAEVRGINLATNWDSTAPRLIWQQRVGPAWSSMAIVGKRLFTQEQRGEFETVVCLDSETGQEIWAHEDPERFWEPVSGAGPRATPAFADGRLFTLGATGLLNCLDALTGRRIWSRDVGQDAGAPVPQWAFCGSPLVAQGVVIVFAGGPGEKQLLAYETATGTQAWGVPAGSLSYGSPQLVDIDGTPQVLILSDRGLTAVSPVSGATYWEYSAAIPGAPRSVEACVAGPSQVVVATEAGIGLVVLNIEQNQKEWIVSPEETSQQFKPAFSDFVAHQGNIYGFDGAIFACVDLKTGKRSWKQGRYGHGQVLLLADQGVLLVLAETGEIVLVAAIPERHEELARFQAIDGKTWNHPAVAHGRLYVRNAEEIAAYELPLQTHYSR
jgi:outer membrane protein assembly factor BamB